MSRRLVSYSDLTEDGPEARQTSGEEAGPSRYVNVGEGVGGAKKRKLASNAGGARKRTGRGRGEGVHWDDPTYAGQMGKEDGLGAGGYRDLGDGEQVDDEGIRGGSVGGNGYSRDDRMSDEGDGGEENGGEEGVYTGWKYDEWGEPYDGTQAFSEEAYDDDYGDYDSENDSNHTSSDNNATLPFVIPDVDEYHRQHDPHPSPRLPSTTPSAPHRPPHAVGGGGRTLTHLELYSPLSLVQTFNSALAQYCTLHALPLPRFSGFSDSALWNDAPKHDSLLAQQVREDTQQVLAQRGTANGRGAGIGANSSSSGGGVKSQQQQGKARGKPIVTAVPAIGIVGNAAWKKAIRTVETTPNRVGWIWPAIRTTTNGAETDGPNGVYATHPKTVAGHILAGDSAASSTKSNAPTRAESELEKQLHHHWYAGYYAALAACGVTPSALLLSSVPPQTPQNTAPTPHHPHIETDTTLPPDAPSSTDPHNLR